MRIRPFGETMMRMQVIGPEDAAQAPPAVFDKSHCVSDVVEIT
jgi:hypothetical protein